MNRTLIGAALILSLSLAACSTATPPASSPDAALQGQSLPAGPASSQPSLSLSSPSSSLNLTAAAPTTFTVTVKNNNVTGPIKLHLNNLPINVTAPDVTLAAGKNSATLTLTQIGRSPAKTTLLQVQASASTVSASLGLLLTVDAPQSEEPTQAATDPGGPTQGSDFTAPTALTFAPANGAVGLSHTSLTTSVTFSEAMNKTSAQQAFQLMVPFLDQTKKSFAWNAAGTVMTMTYNGAVPYGSTAYWGMSNTATDLAGNHLINPEDVGGQFKVVRQKTVKLYSNAALDLGSSYDPAHQSFFSPNAFGGAAASVGQMIASSPYEMRAFLQFPLNNLVDLSHITKINAATLNINTITTINHPEDLGDVLVDPISTPLYFKESGLWFGSAINLGQTKHILTDGIKAGTHNLDITNAFATTIKNSAQFYGLSQWRIKFEHDEIAQIASKIVAFGLGANTDVNKRPYILVTYEYP